MHPSLVRERAPPVPIDDAVACEACGRQGGHWERTVQMPDEEWAIDLCLACWCEADELASIHAFGALQGQEASL